MHSQVSWPARVLALGGALTLAGVTRTSNGWNAHGHRTITILAVEGLPASMPAWIREEPNLAMIAEQSAEPDRWRGTRTPPMGHENGPDHFLDVELLAQFGLSLDSLPEYRYDYVKTMAIAKHEHPERVRPYDAAADDQRQYEWPGFAPYAVTEHYAKLQASFNTLRILEGLVAADPAQGAPRATQIRLAKSNVVYHMGVLSHFVGDLCQPLHATEHHHGWVGDNPNGYTTDRGFHAYIDGAILDIHRLDAAALRPGMTYGVSINAADPWRDTIAYLGRTFKQVEPLYALNKSGDLEREPGRALIAGQLRDGAAVLSALYAAAWTAGEPTDRQVADYLRFNAAPEWAAAPAK